MKKVIVIASAVISILFAVILIVFSIEAVVDKNPLIGPSLIVSITNSILSLLIILISSLVIFNIKLLKALRISLAVIAIPLTIYLLVVLGIIMFNSLAFSLHPYRFIIGIVGIIAVIITLGTYIRQALWPGKEGQ